LKTEAGCQRGTIAADDDSRGRTFTNAVGECAGHALAEIAVALRAARPAIAEPMLHRVRVVTGKTDFQFPVLRLAQSVGGSERAKHKPAMQRGCAFRAKRGGMRRVFTFPATGKRANRISLRRWSATAQS
jgi:hypothetical protein